MKRPTEPQLMETVDFFDQLIDDRFMLIEALGPLALHNYKSSGLCVQLHSIPLELGDFIQAEQAGSVQVGLAHSVEPNGDLMLQRLDLEPSDGRAVSIQCDGFATNISLDAKSVAMYFGDGLIEECLRSLVPLKMKPAPIKKIASSIHECSPEMSHVMEISGAGDDIFSVAELETGDDSQQIISMRRVWPHISGKAIDLSATISETLKKASAGQTAGCDVNIGLGERKFLFDEIVNGQSVSVRRPTRLHTNVFRNMVEAIIDESVAKQTAEAQ